MIRVPSSRRLKTAAGVAFCVLSVAGGFLAARRLTSSSWPLQEANVVLVLGAAAAYLASFIFRALGWQRLFPGEKPDRSRCLAACGAAAASGVVLPFRLGATSGVLLALGVTQDAAINFSLASGMLLTGSALAATVIGVGGSLFFTVRRRYLSHATLA